VNPVPGEKKQKLILENYPAGYGIGTQKSAQDGNLTRRA
jgi:hypothetical protein